MSNLGQGYWERPRVGGTYTRDTGEKDNSVTPYLLQVSARFLLSELRPISMTSTKSKWGQSVAWLIFGMFFPT